MIWIAPAAATPPAYRGHTRGHAGKQRNSHGGSPLESERKRWPAANHPQTPAVPGARGPPGFGCLGRGLALSGGSTIARSGRLPPRPAVVRFPGPRYAGGVAAAGAIQIIREDLQYMPPPPRGLSGAPG
ncbi:hypothetical protein BO86DRAFT_402187 [Aspergillus japonicus CBS 114.51]|uniref:Uncharacterized protein n=1 Tax=Aspergillus japonicus CBS 114.51 TaxID=1448312 RepID=A0A8T8WTQ8_ASPJA|nr:hypothetical protein BO86DRAFT_402187 [Aspergillus japonicus CBS 114.51]RAH79163.1 hypothetical protein BO86DRAFT_402187 [Aspergillus japonicus CBS 114.51]